MRLLAMVLVLVGFNVAFANEGVKSCVNTRFLGGHKVVDQNNLIFENGSKDILVTTRGCDLNRADRLVLRLQSSWLCKGDRIELQNQSGFYAGTCVITAMADQ